MTLQSAIPLPELRPSHRRPADATIQLRHLEWPPPELREVGTGFHFTPAEAYLRWHAVGTFWVRDGREVLIEPAPGVEEDRIRLPLLGAVLAVLLHQRGHFVLHASAVAVSGSAAIFLGEKGQGKSTLAAALYARGHELLADDLVVLDIEDTLRPMVRPGFPQFKLWPDAVASSLGDDPTLLPRVATGTEKRARRIVEHFSPHALPLGGIFVLGEGPAIHLRSIKPAQGLLQLITHTYVARFGNRLLQGVTAATHLRQCADLVRCIPTFHLERPRSLELLPDVVQVVEEQMRS